MASLGDLSLLHRAYVKRYRFDRWAAPADHVAPPAPALSKARVALVTTGGLHLPEQEPFDRERRGGDPSFRVIPGDADPATLRCSHRSDAFDHDGVDADPELAFPLTALRTLQREGVISAVSPVHLSYMGSITKPEELVRVTAPEGVAVLAGAAVDVALLVPL